MGKKNRSKLRPRDLDRKLETTIVYCLSKKAISLDSLQKRLLFTFGIIVETDGLLEIIYNLRSKNWITKKNIKLSKRGSRIANKLKVPEIKKSKRTKLLRSNKNIREFRKIFNNMQRMYKNQEKLIYSRLPKGCTVNRRVINRNIILSLEGLVNEYRKRKTKVHNNRG